MLLKLRFFKNEEYITKFNDNNYWLFKRFLLRGLKSLFLMIKHSLLEVFFFLN